MDLVDNRTIFCFQTTSEEKQSDFFFRILQLCVFFFNTTVSSLEYLQSLNQTQESLAVALIPPAVIYTAPQRTG